MGNLLFYSGLTTKIRAMQKNFLNEDAFREIVELPGIPQAVAYLKQTPSYQDIFAACDESALHRGTIENMLRSAIYRDFTKLYRFSNVSQRHFLALYFKRYEVFLIKKCLNNIFDRRNTSLNLSTFGEFFRKHSQLNLPALAASSTIEEFLSNLQGTDYYRPLNAVRASEHCSLFDYETTLDLFYFSSIWKLKDKLLRKSDLREITDAYGHKFDLLNLQWIYRAKTYYRMTPADIYMLLIPANYKLTTNEITALAEAETADTFHALLAKTYYARHWEEFSPDRLEALYSEVMHRVLSTKARKNPYSMITIYSYLYHREHEVKRLTIALECVRYRVSPAEAMQYVLKA